MNYYKQIAEMLGVELGEEFSLKNIQTEDINRSRYKITQEEGLMYSIERVKWARSTMLLLIINGDFSVVKLPWKPKLGEKYWYYSINSEIALWTPWYSSGSDLENWKIGNFFKTHEEALDKGKKIMEAIQKEYEEA